MPIRSGESVGLVACLVVVACWGCGGGGTPSVSSSTEEADVKGSVTIKGKTATGGEIQFDPSNINRRDAKIYTAPIGKDGSYTSHDAGRRECGPGPEAADDRDPSLMDNQVNVDIKSGENTIPIDVK